MTSRQFLHHVRGRLIVSCQALPDEALYGGQHMAAMARAVVQGGAAAVRCNGPDDIRAIASAVEVPLIGLWKDGADDEVYITPTVEHALAVADAGADVVAADATDRPRPDGSTFADLVAALAERDVPVMADVSTVADGEAAARAGASVISSTLSGYTPETAGVGGAGPHLELVSRLTARVDVPVVAEGRITTPDQATRALRCGAWAVVVGGAITRPTQITRRFDAALPARREA